MYKLQPVIKHKEKDNGVSLYAVQLFLVVVSATSRARSGESKVLVDNKFASTRVTGGNDSETNDNSWHTVSFLNGSSLRDTTTYREG